MSNEDTSTSTTAVETETGDTETVLTGEETTTDTGTNSDADASASADDTAASDENQGDSDAGAEGSDTPPDIYADFAMPEGMTLNDAVLTEANPLFKDLGLTQENAQKVVDFYAKQVQADSQTQVENFNQLKSDWREQSSNDKEFGGDKFDENVKVAQNAINKYGTPELKQLLEEYGVGSHPEIVRFMVRVGRTLKEDVPGAAGNQSTKVEDRVSILYPKGT